MRKIHLVLLLFYCCYAIGQTSVTLPVDSLTDARHKFLLNNSESDPFWKHNKFAAYYRLHASSDTVLKYLYEAIQYAPVVECFFFQHGPFPISPMLSKDYGPKTFKAACRLCDSIEKTLDSAMIRALIVIDSNDQKYRASEHEPWVTGKEETARKQHMLDSVNQMVIAKMIDKKKKYIGIDLVGFELYYIAFNVILHADLAFEEKYLPMVEKAIKDRNLYRSYYPMLIDKIYMQKGLPQIFGTQLIPNKKRDVMELYKVQNLSEVNKLRKQYDLEPLNDYLKANHAVIPDKTK